ncbi:MAG: hypothetical protein ACRC91_06415 [Aeromonas sp.]
MLHPVVAKRDYLVVDEVPTGRSAYPARPLVKPLTGLTLVARRLGMAVSGRQNMGA